MIKWRFGLIQNPKILSGYKRNIHHSKKQKINENKKNTSVPYYLLNEIEHYNLINISLFPDYFDEDVQAHAVIYKEKLIQLEKNDYCPINKKLRNKNKERKEIKDKYKYI